MQKIVVDAEKFDYNLRLKELVDYKDLFIILAYRDLRIRYSQTFLGILWVIIQPVATLLILVIVFGKAVKVDTEGIPYPLFAVTGIATWTYFSYVLNQSGNSIITSQEMVKKIYFPRLIIPLSKAMVGFVDFFIALLLIVILMVVYGRSPDSQIIYLPCFILLTVISALAIGIWLSALTIRFRDFQHMVPFWVQFGLYATPVGYPASLVIENFPTWAVIIYYLNPMAGIVEGFRWSLLGGNPPSIYMFYSIFIVLFLMVSSLFYFRRVERSMADLV